MTLAKGQKYMSPRNLILSGVLLLSLSTLLNLVHAALFDCSGYLGDHKSAWQALRYFDIIFKTLSFFALYCIPVGAILFVVGIGMYVKRKALLWLSIVSVFILVVVFLIALSIVLASLDSARLKGPNASIKAYLSMIRVEGESYFDVHTTFGTPTDSCAGPDSMFMIPTVQRYILDAEKLSGHSAECKSNGIAYVVAISQVLGGPRDVGFFCKVDQAKRDRWCVDSMGNSRWINSPIEGFSCPTSPSAY